MKKISFILLGLIIFFSPMFSQSETTLSTEEKLYELSMLWKEASYNFAFFDQVPNLNWDSCYQAFIPLVMETKTDWEHYMVLKKFFVLLEDGLTKIKVKLSRLFSCIHSFAHFCSSSVIQ